ncbi:hypothetical protein EPUL_005764, partial [Erysiphe pulchra]
TPPKGQSREDRRVMIRLGPEHEARKTGAFELRQKVQELVSDKLLVSDAWAVPSGVAILAPTPAKAAAILQNKTAIENRFGKLAALKEIVPIRYMNWTRRSQDDQAFGHIRISVPEAKSNKFPPRLRLFGEAVTQAFPVSGIRYRDELETEARELVTVIKTALTGACPQKRLQNRGTPWWNDECRQAAHA